MDALREIIAPPTAQQMGLLWLLLGVSLVIHLAFMGMVIGGTTLSVVFRFLSRSTKNPMHERFARDVIDAFVGNKGVGILLGVVPLFTISLIYIQMYTEVTTLPVYFWIASIVLVLIGLGQIYYYQDKFPKRDRGFFLHLGAGVAGLGALKAAYLVFFFGVTLLIDPEKWIVLNPSDPFWSWYSVSLSWNHIIRTLHFVIMAMAMTGVGVVFFFNHWPGKIKENADPEYRDFAKKIGIALALPMISVQPILWLANIHTMPPAAVSASLMEITIPALIFAAVVCHLLYSTLRNKGSKYGAWAFCLYLIVFATMVGNEQQATANATREYLDLANFNAKKNHEARKDKAMREWKEAPDNLGEQIFASRCISCHSLEPGVRKFGPSLHGMLGRKTKLASGKEIVADADYIRKSISDPDADIVESFSAGQMSGPIPPGEFAGMKLKALVKYLTGPKTGNEVAAPEEEGSEEKKETEEKK